MTWFTFLSFVENRCRARPWRVFHSPYLFRLFSYCCNEEIGFEKFSAIESWRKDLLKNKTQIERKDFGSGSTFSGKKEKNRITDIARHSLSLPFQCRFLSRLIQSEGSKNILELGTSLGISTCYLQVGNPSSRINTVEGDPEIAKVALSTFAKLEMKGIHLVASTFELYLDNTKEDHTPVDILFLDGNHRSEALLTYYLKLKSRFTKNTILIVDDIYWSKDMQEGWNKLIAMPEVTQSVDCFQFGLLFFRDAFLQKEHHRIRLPLRSIFR